MTWTIDAHDHRVHHADEDAEVCSCVVIDHPAGPVWVAMTPDRTCPQHRHGQPYQDAA